MTIVEILEEAASIAKKTVLENLDRVTEKTGEMNPFGDKTLLLDKQAEDNIIDELNNSGLSFVFLTEEQGIIQSREDSDYYAVIDPIDGSANLERGVPLVCVGISVIPYAKHITTDDVEVSVVDSFFTDETYIAQSGKGVTLNGKRVKPSNLQQSETAIISYDTKRSWKGEFGMRSLEVIKGVHDVRRTGSNLLDLCWTASGALDAMIDLRGILPLVHVSGTHIVLEAGGYVVDQHGQRFTLPMEMNRRMSFIAAGTEELAQQLFTQFNSVSI